MVGGNGLLRLNFKSRVRQDIYPSLSVTPILNFQCHRVPQLSANRETRCNREYGIGSTEIENQINPRHSVRPRIVGWFHRDALGRF